MTTGFVHDLAMENRMEKQLGCMAGFLQIFDRNQILYGKRHYKRLLAPPVVGTVSDARESEKAKQQIPPSPERLTHHPPAKLPLPLIAYETKPLGKTFKETPRLSLDSRATTDAKGGLHPKEMRSSASNVVAKLMGLEPLPSSASTIETEKKPSLQRSSSESGASRGFSHSRLLMEATNFHLMQQNQSDSTVDSKAAVEYAALDSSRYADLDKYSLNNVNPDSPNYISNRTDVNLSPWKTSQHRKSFFDTADIFPEPKRNVSKYGEIEKRLKIRGIDEPTKDAEALKNILEALQLKGLLRSTKPPETHTRQQNAVYEESPIVVMKPSRSSIQFSPIHRRKENEYLPFTGRSPSREFRQNYNYSVEDSRTFVPRLERNWRNSIQSECTKRSNSLAKPKQLSAETHRRAVELIDNRRVSPIHSSKLNARKIGSDLASNNRPPRMKKAAAKDKQREKKTFVAGEDESSPSNSGSSISTSTDTEGLKADGRNLLERCDKLLHSIAVMASAADMHPSPVSVLDSSLYRVDSVGRSSVSAKRRIHFKDTAEEETLISPAALESLEDPDFVYMSEMLGASHLFLGESDLFLLLEKRKEPSSLSRLRRKVVFDAINEILTWIRRLPPWENVQWTNHDGSLPCISKVWLEFQRLRDLDESEDMYETICGVLKKDFAGDMITGWKDRPTELSEMILDMERFIFKDLITETIRDLAALNRLSIRRRYH